MQIEERAELFPWSLSLNLRRSLASNCSMSCSKIGSRLSSNLITKAKAVAAVRKHMSTCQPPKRRASPSQCQSQRLITKRKHTTAIFVRNQIFTIPTKIIIIEYTQKKASFKYPLIS